MSFRLGKHAETFISPVSILKNIVLKAIRYMICHFHNRRVVKALRYINHVETMHDKWKQTPYPICFLRRCATLRFEIV